MSREFTSVLAGDMRAFIEFKHAAGVAFVGGQYLLGRLDAYLTATGAQGLTKDAVEGFIADYDGDRVGADRSYFSYLRGFAHCEIYPALSAWIQITLNYMRTGV